tara:strand:+ start:1856 stop:2029 length:174 start_codon:yes stop_codon:yes gene_type:complete
MKKEKIKQDLINLKETLVSLNTRLKEIEYQKRQVKSQIQFYENRLINQVEMDFDDCE